MFQPTIAAFAWVSVKPQRNISQDTWVPRPNAELEKRNG